MNRVESFQFASIHHLTRAREAGRDENALAQGVAGECTVHGSPYEGKSRRDKRCEKVELTCLDKGTGQMHSVTKITLIKQGHAND